ncbi:MAG: hypothetical protein WAX77_02110 [Methylococcaceae bacterium]
MNTLINNIEQLEKEAQEQVLQLDSSIDDLKEIVSGEFSQLKSENKKLKSDVQNLEQQLQQAQQSIASLSDTQQRHHDTLLKLVQAFKSVNEKVEELKSSFK